MYEAIINVPGYLPMADQPAIFDTAKEAWQYLADERERGLEDVEEISDDDVWHYLVAQATDVDDPGVGTAYGSTPGIDSEHDLGLAYSVVVVEGHPWDCRFCAAGEGMEHNYEPAEG